MNVRIDSHFTLDTRQFSKAPSVPEFSIRNANEKKGGGEGGEIKIKQRNKKKQTT